MNPHHLKGLGPVQLRINDVIVREISRISLIATLLKQHENRVPPRARGGDKGAGNRAKGACNNNSYRGAGRLAQNLGLQSKGFPERFPVEDPVSIRPVKDRDIGLGDLLPVDCRCSRVGHVVPQYMKNIGTHHMLSPEKRLQRIIPPVRHG
jgi:hypothetical protein